VWTLVTPYCKRTRPGRGTNTKAAGFPPLMPVSSPFALRLAPTHLGWGTRRHFTHRSRDPRSRNTDKWEEGRGGAFPRIDREVNIIFEGHGAQESRRQQKLNDRQVLVATNSAPALYRWSEHMISFSRADQWLNFDHPGKYLLLVDPVI
jgi:hypothetical protein